MTKRMTSEDFVKKAINVHGDRYDYSGVEYKGSKEKVGIRCREHGIFWQFPCTHYGGGGCPECARKKCSELWWGPRGTTVGFIEKSRGIHGDVYDYSKVVYENNNSMVEIICPKHGLFIQQAGNHLQGRGCKECGSEKNSVKRLWTTEKFIKRAKEVHKDVYDYSKVVYTHGNEEVEIICLQHGSFWVKPARHIHGPSGCSKCLKELRSRKQTHTFEYFLKQAKEVHGNTYDYSKAVYKNKDTKIELICRKHGSFWICPRNHIWMKAGCFECGVERTSSSSRYTTEKFVALARETHGDKYDYSKVNYVNRDIKVEIICPDHGTFWQIPSQHLYGRKCNRCAGRLITNQEDFLKASKKAHGDTYDYSEAVYMGASKKVKIWCSVHGWFWQMAKSHTDGRGCEKCGLEKMAESNRIGEEEIIRRSREVHGDTYDYNLIKDYVNISMPMKIICSKHGIFEQSPSGHIHQKQGCPKCGIEKCAENNTWTQEEFLEEAKKVHAGMYDYSKSVYIHNNQKIDIICKKHGSFFQTPACHLRKEQGCPVCAMSRGEGRIRAYLENGKIRYETQKTFDGCRNPKTNRLLKFDFYVPLLSLLIEFDGPQHYQVGGYVKKHQITAEEVAANQFKDEVKNQYAKNEGIQLIRIRHEDYKKLDEILDNVLVF